jgi:hypothetical protein
MKRLALLLLLACACGKTNPEPTPEVRPDPTQSTQSTGLSTAPKASDNKEKEIAWDAPSSWQSMPNANAMRKATYKIGDDTELTVSSAAGGVDANVKRWAGQFGDAQPKTEKKTVNGLDVTIVEINGPYQGMGGPKKDGYMLLGAVVDGGQMQTFFKMTGPEKVVKSARPDFDKLVSSLRPKS